MTNESANNSTTNITINTSSQPTPPSSTDPVEPGMNKYIIAGVICVVVGLGLGALVGVLFGKSTPSQSQSNNTTANPSTDTRPFKIGFIAPLTGDGASYGVPAKQAALVVQKEINQNGGFGGRTVEVIPEDGRCSDVDAKAAAEKLLNEDNVDLLYGGECSDEFMAVAPLAQKKKIITISGSATSPKITDLSAKDHYIFRTIPSDSLAGKAASEYGYNKLTAKTAAVILEDTSYAQALGQVFTDHFTELGGKVVINTTYKTGDTDFSGFITDLKKEKPDLVYIVPQTVTPGVLIVKAIKNNKLDVKLLTSEVLLTRDEIPKQGQILEGVIGLEAYVDDARPKAKHVIELYKKEYGEDATYPTDLVAINDLFYTYKEAYDKVGSNTDKISEYLYNLKNWDGASGEVTFDKNGDIISLPYAIQLIKDKKVSLIETFKVEK